MVVATAVTNFHSHASPERIGVRERNNSFGFYQSRCNRKLHTNCGHMRALAPGGPSMDKERSTNLLSTKANKYHFQHTGKLGRATENALDRIEAINNDAVPIGGCEK